MLFPASRRLALSPKWTRDILWRRARAVPSLDLRFADNKSLVDATTGQNLVTFTRASSGTYVDSQGVIRTATANEARFDHAPTTGESLGLLVEESRTNNVLQSEDFATTWTTSNLTVTTNSVIAPDGTTTADTIAPPIDGLTAQRFLRQNPALTTQQAYTFSVFVKVGTATTNGIALYVADSTATNNFRSNFNLFNLTTSPAASGWATPTATIVPYPNGWYRCILSGVTSTAHTALRAVIYLNFFGNSADSYGSIHIWGAQLEAGSFPTSYIPTTTAAATRSADVASITGSNFSSWYRQDEGTVFAEFTPRTFAQACGLLSIDDGTASERLQTRLSTNGNGAFVVADGGSVQANFTTAASTSLNTKGKLATSFAVNSFKASLNGGSVASDASGTLPTVTQAVIGNAVGAFVFNGPLSRITFWPKELSESTLQGITQQ
jgi:hypothetical protein